MNHTCEWDVYYLKTDESISTVVLDSRFSLRLIRPKAYGGKSMGE